MEKEKNIIKIIDIFILLLFFATAFYWSTKMQITYAPDETMRYVVPEYIYNHNHLPKPDDPEVVHKVFNASYAYYPLLLGAIIGAIFMKIVGAFGVNEIGLLIAARFVNVLSGTIFVYFLMKIANKIFNKRAAAFATILGAFVPQFLYLSSYINNDSIALAGSSIIVYSWVLAMEKEWNYKNSILLSIGIVICALSYYNAYGWILMSIVFFISRFIKTEKENRKVSNKEDETALEKLNNKIIFDWKNMLKYGVTIIVIVLLSISYLFIRNYLVNNGDLLGMRSFLAACEKSEYEFIRPSNRNTAKNIGVSWIEMLFSKEWTGTSWIKSTATSFICVLGAIQYPISNIYYYFYWILFAIGLVSMIFAFIINTKGKIKLKIFYFCLFIAAIIPIILGIRYSYATDYQAQR